jgi:hypothetical protein
LVIFYLLKLKIAYFRTLDDLNRRRFKMERFVSYNILEDYKPPLAVQYSRATLPINELKRPRWGADLNLNRCIIGHNSLKV